MKRIWSAALLLSLIALPATAGGVLRGGSDLWVTPGNGSTWTDFASQPIPAGFFCNRSAAFTGRIAFKGVPLATDSPAVLRGADTIIERLDDAELNGAGKGETRLQVRALNLVSVAPLSTACGQYNVRATLAGEQPMTKMRIFQENANGGRYLAPLALNVKLTFTPVGRQGAALEMIQRVRFPADPRASWSISQNKGASARYIKVDTDGDGRADTLLPPPSNFQAGVRSDQKALYYETTIDEFTPGYFEAHTSPTHQHATTPPPPPPPTGGGGGGVGGGGGELFFPEPIN